MGSEYRIHVSGDGSISGPIAMGDHASATVNNVGAPSAAEAERLLARLEQLINQHAGSLDAPNKALRDVADVRQELSEREPDTNRVSDALKRIAARAAEVGVIVEVVDQVRGLFS